MRYARTEDVDVGLPDLHLRPSPEYFCKREIASEPNKHADYKRYSHDFSNVFCRQ
jgi:elongation factor P--beta-lysine ligase